MRPSNKYLALNLAIQALPADALLRSPATYLDIRRDLIKRYGKEKANKLLKEQRKLLITTLGALPALSLGTTGVAAYYLHKGVRQATEEKKFLRALKKLLKGEAKPGTAKKLLPLILATLAAWGVEAAGMKYLFNKLERRLYGDKGSKK